jgi:hypothetical protein
MSTRHRSASEKERHHSKKHEQEEFFATRKENISLSPVDFFSFGHIIMGMIIYLLVIWLFSSIPFVQFGAIICAVIIGIIWEIIENTVFFAHGYKAFENHRDSVINSFMDVIFDLAGALIAFFIPILWIDIVILVACVIVMLILGSMVK